MLTAFFSREVPPWAVKTTSVKWLSGPKRDKSAKREPAIAQQLAGWIVVRQSDFPVWIAQLSKQGR